MGPQSRAQAPPRARSRSPRGRRRPRRRSDRFDHPTANGIAGRDMLRVLRPQSKALAEWSPPLPRPGAESGPPQPGAPYERAAPAHAAAATGAATPWPAAGAPEKSAQHQHMQHQKSAQHQRMQQLKQERASSECFRTSCRDALSSCRNSSPEAARRSAFLDGHAYLASLLGHGELHASACGAPTHVRGDGGSVRSSCPCCHGLTLLLLPPDLP